MENTCILLVEDESLVSRTIKLILNKFGYNNIIQAFSGEEAIKAAIEKRPGIILMDIKLKDNIDGITAAERILEEIDIPIIYLTSYTDVPTLERAKRTFPYGYLIKPVSEKELATNIETALYKHKLEKKVRENEAWFSSTLRSIGDAVIATDTLGKIVFINSSAEELLGYTEDEVVGKLYSDCFKLIDEVTGKDITDFILKAISGGKAYDFLSNTILLRNDGQEIPIDDSIAPIHDAKGKIYGAVWVFKDITEKKQSEKKIVFLSRTYSLLSQINQSIVRIQDKELLIKEICKVSITFGEFCLSAFAKSNSSEEPVEITAKKLDLGESGNLDNNLLLDFMSIIAKKMERGFFLCNSLNEIKDSFTSEINDFLEKNGIVSAGMFSIYCQHKPDSLFLICSKEKDFFNEEELTLLLEVAGDIKFAFETIEKDNLRKRTEETLKESERRFRNIFENSGVGKLITTLDGKILQANRAFLKMTKYRIEDLKGLDVAKITHLSDIEKTRLAEQELIEWKSESVKFEKRYICKDGEKIFAIVTKFLQRDNDDEPMFFINDIMNITAEKIALEEIQENERRIRNIIDSAPYGAHSYELNEQGELIFTGNNKSADRILNIDHSTKMGKTIEEGFPDLSKEIIDAYKNAARNGTPFEKEDLTYSDGVITGAFEILAFQTSKNKMTVFFRNTLDKVNAELQKRESEKRFQLFMKNFPGLAFIKDSNLKTIFVNEGFKTLLGIKPEDMIGKTNDDIFPPEFAAKINNDDREVLTTKESKVFEEEFAGRVWISYKFLIDQIQNEPLLGGFTLDISQRKKMENDLLIAKERAEELNVVKSNFLANMSHELRTPLIGILGYSQILSELMKDKDAKTMASTINRSGNRLLSTLNQILDLSRIEANKYEIEKETIDIGKKIEECFKLYKPFAESKNLSLTYVFMNSNLFVTADIKMVESILNNLVNNAIKFTDEGGVKIIADKTVQDTTEYVEIRVIDTGIGITEGSKNLIFDEFRQASEGFSRAYEGTGLGLTITKKYVELLGGKIEVTSKINEGSVFKILLPYRGIKQNLPKQDMTTDNVEIKGRSGLLKTKILLVDDDEVSFDVAENMLKEMAELDYAENMKRALELVEKNKYSLILLDINLGKGVNGIDLLNEIRKNEYYKKIPVVAFTAYAMIGDREKLLDAGCDFYISKPFSKQSLVEIIEIALHSGF